MKEQQGPRDIGETSRSAGAVSVERSIFDSSYQSIARDRPRFNLNYAVFSCFLQLLIQQLVWGFSVDDAWIVSRVASNGVRFGQFHFNLGQATDAVTPFGFAHFLGGFAQVLGLEQKMSLFHLARWSGLAAQALSFFVAGGLIPAKTKWYFLLPLSLGCLPSTLWAGAGLATPWVGLSLSIGLLLFHHGRFSVAGFCFGVAGALRPELIFFSAALAVTFLRGRSMGLSRSAVQPRLLLVALSYGAPIVVVALSRFILFDTPLPLSAVAKAPQFSSGVHYLIVSLVWGGLLGSCLLLPRWWNAGSPGWAVGAHLLALLLCGGDWMPGLRLSAPIYPCLLALSGLKMIGDVEARRWRARAVAILSPLMPAVLLWQQGEDLRAVVQRRCQLVVEAAPYLKDAQVIAAVDVGWVGMSSDSTIVDLGGVTDPSIGRLPGGHTHRPLSAGLFSARNVDAWVIRAADRSYRPGQPLRQVAVSYGTDFRLLSGSAELGMSGVATIFLQGTPGQYVIGRLDASF